MIKSRRAHIVIDGRIRRSSTGRYMDRLVTHLQKIDDFNRYTILVHPDDPWKMDASNFHTLPCPFMQFSFNPLDQIRFAWQLYRLKADLVHFTMTQQPLLYFGKIVTTTHDLTMFRFIKRGATPVVIYNLKLRLYHFMMWLSHRKSKYILVPTHTTAKEVATFQPFTEKKLVVTYEAAAVTTAVKPKKPSNITGRFIMYVGTAFPHKNLSTLVDAFNIVHTEQPDLKLVLVGKTERHYEEMAAYASQTKSSKSIIFTGFIPDQELRWLFEHGLCYVFTSLSEGFGLPPLDAMANGLPVVSSNASVMPEVYGNAAHYCNAHDPKDVAQKILEVLDTPELREKLIKAGKEQVKKYSWHTMAEETLAVYKSTLQD
ncbi:MAG: glycosyltransferase family 4 protein [Candidatus Saccharimonadales bacterium]